MHKVIIASKNPVKINAVKQAFEKMLPNDTFEYEGISVPSEVSDQPMSDTETYTGAKNRAHNAEKEQPDADYWVGIEGGLQKVGNELKAFAWVVIHSPTQTGKARTATFFLPPQVTALINQGKELGEADDIVFKRHNSKQQNGAVGILTGDVSNRTQYYYEAVVFALVPFKNVDLYKKS